MSKKILLLTTEPLPYQGMETTGAGLRAWGLAEGLKSKGFKVHAAMPFQSIPQNREDLKEKLSDFCFYRHKLNEYIKKHSPDVIVLQHWGMFRDLGEINCPLAIDLAGPHLLERRFWGSNDFEGDLYEKLSALRAADFLVCSGEYQRLYFLPYLMSAGWDINENSLPVIPFSISPTPCFTSNENIEKDTFVFSGRFLPWQSPEKPIRWLLDVFTELNKGKLIIYGGIHPFGDVSEGKFIPLLKELQNNPRVIFKGTLPFFELLSEISKISIALDLLPKNPERELAFTSRTMMYFWANTPVIYNDYSEISQLIEKYNIGWTLNSDDEQAFKKLIQSIMNNTLHITEKRANIQQFQQEYNWEKTINPLSDFCDNANIRKNKIQSLLNSENKEFKIKELEKTLSEVKSELLTIKGKFLIKILLKMGFLKPLFSVVIFLILLPFSLLLATVFTINDKISKF